MQSRFWEMTQFSRLRCEALLQHNGNLCCLFLKASFNFLKHLVEFFNRFQASDAISLHMWWSQTLFCVVVTRHQLARDEHRWFSSPNGGMFILTQTGTCVPDVNPALVKHHTRLHMLFRTKNTHQHLKSGLHSDCFGPTCICFCLLKRREIN